MIGFASATNAGFVDPPALLLEVSPAHADTFRGGGRRVVGDRVALGRETRVQPVISGRWLVKLLGTHGPAQFAPAS